MCWDYSECATCMETTYCIWTSHCHCDEDVLEDLLWGEVCPCGCRDCKSFPKCYCGYDLCDDCAGLKCKGCGYAYCNECERKHADVCPEYRKRVDSIKIAAPW